MPKNFSAIDGTAVVAAERLSAAAQEPKAVCGLCAAVALTTCGREQLLYMCCSDLVGQCGLLQLFLLPLELLLLHKVWVAVLGRVVRLVAEEVPAAAKQTNRKLEYG